MRRISSDASVRSVAARIDWIARVRMEALRVWRERQVSAVHETNRFAMRPPRASTPEIRSGIRESLRHCNQSASSIPDRSGRVTPVPFGLSGYRSARGRHVRAGPAHYPRNRPLCSSMELKSLGVKLDPITITIPQGSAQAPRVAGELSGHLAPCTGIPFALKFQLPRVRSWPEGCMALRGRTHRVSGSQTVPTTIRQIREASAWIQ